MLRIIALKNKIANFLNSNRNLENESDNMGLSLDLDTLKASKTNLDNFVNDYASPQTKDKLKNKNRNCLHLLSKIEKHNGFYRCDYCWDSDSESFLKLLKDKGIIQNKPADNNQSRERERERERERANSVWD